MLLNELQRQQQELTELPELRRQLEQQRRELAELRALISRDVWPRRSWRARPPRRSRRGMASRKPPLMNPILIARRVRTGCSSIIEHE
jgi:hypothetical protein